MEANTQSIVRPAGFWIRAAAIILDAIVVMVPLTFISYLITGAWGEDIYTNIISILYGLILPVIWLGYTVGKRIVGIRIVKVNGDKVGFGTMLMRVIVASIIYGVTLGIALIVSAFMIGLRNDKRSIHDFIAGTYVTYEKPGN
ncbi:RDD family protein [Paenibacillus alkaliterrae]|uniref:RDD family protein n=1 Tax=Paenibacillus alkaliterrae TaxID=320909 RepID=UPI001F17771D|nr:RDD family protein [Paenibacillus alkaliterrae]MCF2937734.1 RDD family protein [Paenibacillus alkaliterrae]